MVVVQVGEVVREIGEVVPDAELDVLSEMPVEGDQGATASFIEIGQVEYAPLERSFPVSQILPVGSQNEEMGVVTEEVPIMPSK